MPGNSSSRGLEVSVSHSLSDIRPAEWDALVSDAYPFARHCFLHGLEQHECLEPFGWYPAHFLVREQGLLLAALPCYIKTNSYGELVFDHAWVHAYERNGLDYYPKLVSAIPYTPATGDRFLINREHCPGESRRLELQELLCRAVQGFCSEQKLSSWHILFAERAVLEGLSKRDILCRSDVQFHWSNDGYTDFDAFLARLSSRKRKNIRKERASVAAQGLDIRMLPGGELEAQDWRRIHDLYAGIYRRKYGTATLTADFFRHLGEHMPEQVLACVARDKDQIVAASLFFRSETHLYGRVWGSDQYYHNLHFECCYYQGIDYCIAHGLDCFDPGAQGEHKLARGFLPTRTWSGHWIAHPQFRDAIAHFLEQESGHVSGYREALMDHSPYRQTEES